MRSAWQNQHGGSTRRPNATVLIYPLHGGLLSNKYAKQTKGLRNNGTDTLELQQEVGRTLTLVATIHELT